MNIEKFSKETITNLIKNIVYHTGNQKIDHSINLIDEINSQYYNELKDDLYIEILEIFSEKFGIFIDIENIPNSEVLFHITNILYRIIISNTYSDILEFIISYIKTNMESIYKSLELNKKRIKDVDTLYNISIFDDNITASVLSKLSSVIDMIINIDFDNNTILEMSKYNKESIDMLNMYTSNVPFIILRYREFLSSDIIKSRINNDIKLYFYNENNLNKYVS